MGTVCGVAAMQVCWAGSCFFVSSFAAKQQDQSCQRGDSSTNAQGEDREERGRAGSLTTKRHDRGLLR